MAEFDRLGGGIEWIDVEFGEKADFASIAISDGRFSATDAVFQGEVWFTHAVIEGVTDLSRTVFKGQTHLRDADFRGDLSLRGVEGSGQTWLAGSTVTERFDCSGAQFDYFQFTATIHGDADFEHSEFVDKAVFTSSTFHGRVWFDEASFAGSLDFSKARFTDQYRLTAQNSSSNHRLRRLDSRPALILVPRNSRLTLMSILMIENAGGNSFSSILNRL